MRVAGTDGELRGRERQERERKKGGKRVGVRVAGRKSGTAKSSLAPAPALSPLHHPTGAEPSPSVALERSKRRTGTGRMGAPPEGRFSSQKQNCSMGICRSGGAEERGGPIKWKFRCTQRVAGGVQSSSNYYPPHSWTVAPLVTSGPGIMGIVIQHI